MNHFLILSITIIFLNQHSCKAQVNTNSSSCETYGTCGPFGSCDSQQSPICSCLQGFIPVSNQEWSNGNWTSGCLRRVPLSCNGTVHDGFLDLERMKLTGYSERWIGLETECEGRCLRNCSCLAYGFDSGIGCMFWSGSLIDVQRFPSGSGVPLHIRVARYELDSRKGGHKNVILIIIIAVMVVGIVGVCVGGFLFWRWKCKGKGVCCCSLGEIGTSKDESGIRLDSVDVSVQETLSRINLVEFPLFIIEVLANATNGFSEDNLLGKGGFGPVYKGVLPNGREIAIKRLSKASRQGLQEFMNEVELISKLQHRNLVKLLGCCVEIKEKMLIYEYMPNNSLDVLLFDQAQDILDWRKRSSIIEGICRGLLYLHRDSRLRIIHRDLKPSNILLDCDWNPKISDFGMARIYETNLDHVSTVRVVGTYGYMAPEYAISGRFSEKSDVFSFGVMMLEIATGRKNTSFVNGEDSSNLLRHVSKLWKEDNVAPIIDSRISDPSDMAHVLRYIHIGLLCVQELPQDRPSISSILSMLISDTYDLPEPRQPAFPERSYRSITGTSSSQPGQTSGSSVSVNDVTLSMVDGR